MAAVTAVVMIPNGCEGWLLQHQVCRGDSDVPDKFLECYFDN
jgi:hypothetical protein